jgi:negative regulator of sigma E activity
MLRMYKGDKIGKAVKMAAVSVTALALLSGIGVVWQLGPPVFSAEFDQHVADQQQNLNKVLSNVSILTEITATQAIRNLDFIRQTRSLTLSERLDYCKFWKILLPGEPCPVGD